MKASIVLATLAAAFAVAAPATKTTEVIPGISPSSLDFTDRPIQATSKTSKTPKPTVAPFYFALRASNGKYLNGGYLGDDKTANFLLNGTTLLDKSGEQLQWYYDHAAGVGFDDPTDPTAGAPIICKITGKYPTFRFSCPKANYPEYPETIFGTDAESSELLFGNKPDVLAYDGVKEITFVLEV